jgi:hypothetical protein
MRHYIQQFVWYVFVIALMLAVIHVGQSYSVVIVDEDFHAMEPNLEPRSTHILVRTDEAIRSPQVNDLIVFTVRLGREEQRWFGRVSATPGMTVTTKDDRILVDRENVAQKPRRMADLEHGLIVPRDTVLVTLDNLKKQPRDFPLSKRLVPTRDILGRLRNP